MEIKGIGNWASIKPQVISWNSEIGKRMGQLGLAKRIVTASDDPGKGAVAGRQQALQGSLEAARGGALMGIALARAGGEALGRVGESFGRLRELAVRAGSGGLSEQDRAGLDAEFQGVLSDLGAHLDGASFAGLELFSGKTVEIQVGPGAGDTFGVILPDQDAAWLAGLEGASIGDPASAATLHEQLDHAAEQLALAQGQLATSEGTLGTVARFASESLEALARSGERLDQADAAQARADETRELLTYRASLALGLHGGLQGDLVQQLLA